MKINEIKPGDTLVAGDHFECLQPSTKVVVRGGPDYLYVACASGNHMLDGQVDADGNLLGFTKA